MNSLGTLVKYELLQLVRDTRTVLLAVVLPVVLLPAILWVGNLTDAADEERVRETEIGLAVVGDDSARALEWLDRAAEVDDSVAGGPLRLTRHEGPVTDSLIGSDRLQLVVSAPGPDARGLPQVELRYRSSSDLSRSASERLQIRLAAVREAVRDSLYRAGGLGLDPDQVLPLRTTNVAAAGREAGALLGTFLLPLLIAMMLTGGSLVAADTLSGEKERGTLETLLTTSVSRNEVVAAKGLAIAVVALVMTVLNVANLGVWIGLGLMDIPAALDVTLTAPGLLALFVLILPVVALLSALLLLVSGWARSYREYQFWFLPVFLLTLVPAGAAALPGLELRSVAVLLPIANIALAMRDVLAGRGDLLFGTLATVITAGAAAGAAVAARSTLSTERLLADSAADRAEFQGGPALFPYRVLRWFALMWVVLLALSLAFGERVGIRGQVLMNLLGLFLGSSILMLRRYRLPVREALALRPVHPLVWPAVLVGAPSGFLVGIGLAEFTSIFLPVPPQMLEAFGQFLLPEGIGMVQLVLLLAVLPGITEEIAFRGLLLHGLRKRLGPVALCLVVGAIFGVFHVSLFRILPTAYLGTMLALVTILTGSIFPAMLWHILNNAVALVPVAMGWLDAEAGVPGWAWPIGVVGLAGSLWVLKRVGRGYPGVTRPEGEGRDAGGEDGVAREGGSPGRGGAGGGGG
ncbi:CPBP family glutamic-type intramembrane protease [Gaopeijia maritima]|uniref:CPBP family glutamic-type intramembrane protease n=1 Tax=Gaopeijia maritima TaxID=3119007 RepID=A0ABU9EET3_9BACT